MMKILLSLITSLSFSSITTATPTTTPSPLPKNQSFNQTLTLHGISFHILSPNTLPCNTLTITPTGLTETNQPITLKITNTITGAEIADLNQDGSPEIYIYSKSPKPNPQAELIAYSANKKKSLSEIYLPPLKEDPKNYKGYSGNDEFAIVESTLCRRFPIPPSDSHSKSPTTRQLQYKLTQGEASWLLKLKQSTDF